MTTRRLGIIRHGKAEDAPLGGDDTARDLAEQGLMDAGYAGATLSGRGMTFDLVLCSPATRTAHTWEAMVHGASVANGLQHGEVWQDRRIYEADAETLMSVLADAPDDAESVLVVGHAPGVALLAEVLADPGESDPAALATLSAGSFPTCTYAELSTQQPWADLAASCAALHEVTTFRA